MQKIWLTLSVGCLALVFAGASVAGHVADVDSAGAAPTPTPTATPTPTPTPPAKVEQKDDAPRISLADAKKDYDAGTAVFVDTRGAESYKYEHVKGAINIPIVDIATKADTIPKGKKIIAYCS